MRPPDDAELLTEYATHNSEKAFTMLVERHVALVHSAALRQVRDPQQAEDVTQAVFILLARKARTLCRHKSLSGWLCRVAHFVSRDALRAERRRLHWENIAAQMKDTDEMGWTHIAPLLDEAVAQLGEKDRNAIVLRFYEQKPLGEVAAVLGVDDDAAQKRVSRALEKLRKFYAGRGMSSSTAIISGAISAHSIQAPPVALAKSVAGVALTKGATASASTLTLIKGALKLMAWTKTKIVIVVGAAVIFAAGTATVIIEKTGAHRQSRPTVNRFADTFEHISPFTGVRFDGDTIIVTYDGAEYQLAAINGISTLEMLDFCRRHYKDLWQKRVAEDLVVVLSDMGHPITAEHTVNLTLVDSKTDQVKQIKNAPMTEANRHVIHESLKPTSQ